MRPLVCLSLAAVASGAMEASDAFSHARDALGARLTLDDEQRLRREAPTFVEILELAARDPEALAELVAASPLAAVAREVAPSGTRGNASLPLVTAHGMGDSCFNRGMKSLTKEAGEHLGVYSTCIPTADTRLQDTIDGFLKNMDKSVDAFAERVRADANLRDGFNAFGLSQGNNVIRGYMIKYNDPPVKTFMSICGINAGVGAFPDCPPTAPEVGPTICKAIAEVCGDLAYLPAIQDILFQADYFRDPARLQDDAYLDNSQLARWNGEGRDGPNATQIANFAKTDSYVWVEGTEDVTVWPREGEQWGAMSPDDPWETVLPMNETAWYATDSFGLRSADAAGKNNFESFKGGHIQFTDAELYAWLDEYFA